MSADLLAEFDSFYQAPDANQKKSHSSAFNDLSALGGSTTVAHQYGDHGSKLHGSQSQLQQDVWGDFSTSQPSVQPFSEPQDDPWGMFESAAPQQTLPQRSQVPQPGYRAAQANAKPAILRRDTLEMFSSRQVDGWSANVNNVPVKAERDPVQSNTPIVTQRKSTFDGDILFDADNLSEDEDEDDFGDFEEAPEVTSNKVVHQTSADDSVKDIFGKLSLSEVKDVKVDKRPAQLSPISPTFDTNTLPYPQAPKSPSFQERNPFAELGVATSQVSKLKDITREASPVTPWPNFVPPAPEPYQDSPVAAAKDDLDDDWGDFEDMPVDSSTQTKQSTGIEADAWAWDMADGVEGKEVVQETVQPPPTNVPPPSILLSIFIPAFELLQSTLFRPVEKQNVSLKNRVLSDPSTIEFLRAYLLIAKVAAYIIAGRKSRWKRDVLLSQAMKIGPAAAGGKGGMKLAGIDKAEVAREDREVADTVRAWKEQLGRLKSAVAIANANLRDGASQLIIPELSEVMHVKSQVGAFSSPKQCIICGLRREERVTKVDVDVEDSFGEWWTEHWGHRSCKNFWLEHESKLKHR